MTLVHSARSNREHVWGVFTPSQNYRFQSISEHDATAWIDRLRSEVHIDEEEEAIVAQSKTMTKPKPASAATYMSDGEDHAGIVASEYSDIGENDPVILSSSPELMGTTSLGHRGKTLPFSQEYSGNEITEYSDLSDAPGGSLRHQPSQRTPAGNEFENQQTQTQRRVAVREPTVSGLLGDPERIICHGWLQCLHSKRGVRQWKKLWVVLRPVSLALYKDERVGRFSTNPSSCNFDT